MAPLLLSLLAQFLGLSVVVVIAGVNLSKYADVLAERTGVGRTMGGLLLLASATSLPELAVDCKAAMIGEPDIAVGAVLGSSIFNLLILGMLDLLFVKADHRLLSTNSSSHLLSAITTVILTSVVVGFIVLKQLPLVFMSVGLGTLLAFLFYVFCLRIIYLDQVQRGLIEEEAEAGDISLGRATLGYLMSTCVIVIAAGYLAPTAERLADVTNLGGTFIGSTMIALTTSLPELVTTLAAVRMGAFDMAVGNILGSNAFNMAILFPVDLFYRTGSHSLLQDAELTNAVTGTAVIIVTAVVMLALSFNPRRPVRWFDPSAQIIVLLAVAAFVVLYCLTPAAATRLPL